MSARIASPEHIAAAAAAIRAGRLVAFPTETVYGLGADATNDAAVAAVFEAKDRPRFNPLIVHVPTLADAEALAVFDERARALGHRFWPGPLTLVLRRREASGLSLLLSAGLPTVALRVPNHPVAATFLRACGRPVAAPSANIAGRLSPTTAAHVIAAFDDRLAMLLDGGPCPVGLESTVIDATAEPPRVLRLGGLAVEAVERLIGPVAVAQAGDAVQAPGMLSRHYAPSIPLRCYAMAPLPGEAFLGFGPETPDADLNLSAAGDIREAAANLFRMLHALDQPTFTGIAVAPVPEMGLGRAINDRLRRAAAASRPADDWLDRGPSGPCVLPDEDP